VSGAAPARAGSVEAVLRERARQLAQARETEHGAGGHVVLPLEVSGQRYAVEALRVHQVLHAKGLHPLLGAPRGVIGAIMCRTRPVGVLDLRALLGLEEGRLADLQWVIVVEDGTDLFGLAVERVLRRLEVPASEVRPAPAGPFLWLAPERLAVLDPARLGVSRLDEAAS
jgi:purine-binding chemotaxis protein CheW